MEVRNLLEAMLDGYDLENKETIISNCELAYSNPQTYLEKNDSLLFLQEMPNSVMNVAVPGELSEILFMGDKIDEIHEKIQDVYPDLPDFPYDQNFTGPEYFEWIDKYYSDNEINNELLQIGDSFGDDLFLILVNRDRTDEIIRLSIAVKLYCKRAKNYLD